jgi:hypothetical protein
LIKNLLQTPDALRTAPADIPQKDTLHKKQEFDTGQYCIADPYRAKA